MYGYAIVVWLCFFCNLKKCAEVNLDILTVFPVAILSSFLKGILLCIEIWVTSFSSSTQKLLLFTVIFCPNKKPYFIFVLLYMTCNVISLRQDYMHCSI